MFIIKPRKQKQYLDIVNQYFYSVIVSYTVHWEFCVIVCIFSHRNAVIVSDEFIVR